MASGALMCCLLPLCVFVCVCCRAADQEALAKCRADLQQSDKCLAVQLLAKGGRGGQPTRAAEMLLMPAADKRHLQAALWEPDAGPDADREVFDPWSLRLE